MTAHGKTFARYALLAVITLGCAEIMSYVGSRIISQRGLLYRPPARLDVTRYLWGRDSDLGWLPAKDEVDQNGARISPAFPDSNGSSCVSIYGDSFAWAEEVDHEHAWGNVLSKLTECPVANYGVGGFGTDQAYMRYVRNKGDRSSVAILTHVSENIMRDVNRLRNLLVPAEGVAFKPRFIVKGDGSLELVPIYTPQSAADLRNAMDHPEAVLPYEWFAPGGSSGLVTLRFPYLLNAVRTLGSFKIRAVLAGRPTHMEFYEPAHPAGALQVSAGIAAAFAREAESRGASPLIVVIPLVPDFRYHRKTGTWPTDSLVKELAQRHVPVLDTGELFEATLKGEDPCSLYMRCGGAHFNEIGYRLIAEFVYRWITDHDTH